MGSHRSLSLIWRLVTPLPPGPDGAVLGEEVFSLYDPPLEFHEMPIRYGYPILNLQATHLQS